MTFYHEKENVQESFGMEKGSMEKEIASVISEFLSLDGDTKMSQLGEILHEKLMYSQILLLATRQMTDVLEDCQDQLIKELLKSLKK
jgi:hypothetical protein